ncbi:hypothetical protein MFIFM68171_02881 [Madurella fahalii]|uniref:Uncharacterized protein n=1 Tax=Madurella fahalii TaxID=1157608 RepID=A0ABQ0G4K5_9PEZI
MADIYTPPPDSAYLLLTPFDMPTESGSVRAVAFSGNSGTLLTAALSVAFTVIFICLWNFICFLFIMSSSEPSRRRYVALVTLWNSNDAWFAFKELASYTYHFSPTYTGDKSSKSSTPSPNTPTHSGDKSSKSSTPSPNTTTHSGDKSSKSSTPESDTDPFWYGLTLTVLAFCVYGGSLVLGIVGPSLVQIGSVAPVRPSSVYYPVTPQPTVYVDILKEFGMRAPGVLRALGSVEAAKVTMRSRVSVDYDRGAGVWENGEPIHRLAYDYRVSGIELGLQHGAGLELAVRGACVTEYSWYADNQRESTDLYQLWGRNDASFPVPIDPYNIQHAPKATFWPHPEAPAQYAKDGNISFAVIVWSAHRTSITEGADPWYTTEPRNSSVDAPYNAQFWMKRARPVLSCWEQNTWSWAGQTVRNVAELKNVTGIKVPQSLLAVLEAAFTTPVLVRLGNASGDSALRSRTTSPNGVIDAGASSIHDDMERLLVASFVASRNVFVDAIMFEQDGTYPNLVQDSTGQPAAGAGDFVVSSPDIQTFSLGGIVAIVVILIVLLLIESVISCIIRLHPHPQKPGKGQETASSNTASTNGATYDRLIRFRVLSALQLFRRIYELKLGRADLNNWPCNEHFPTKADRHEYKLDWCHISNNSRCNGHIEPIPSTGTN